MLRAPDLHFPKESVSTLTAKSAPCSETIIHRTIFIGERSSSELRNRASPDGRSRPPVRRLHRAHLRRFVGKETLRKDRVTVCLLCATRWGRKWVENNKWIAQWPEGRGRSRCYREATTVRYIVQLYGVMSYSAPAGIFKIKLLERQRMWFAQTSEIGTLRLPRSILRHTAFYLTFQQFLTRDCMSKTTPLNGSHQINLGLHLSFAPSSTHCVLLFTQLKHCSWAKVRSIC